MSANHPLRVFAGSANRPLAEAVINILDRLAREDRATRGGEDLPAAGSDAIRLELGACTTTHLADTEIHVSIDEVVREQDVFIIQPCSRPVNDNLMELLLYVDAFRRASAHDITAVVPYYPYARQERMAKGREAISAKVVATMLEALGVGRVIYFDVHSPATQAFFNIPVDPMSALTVLADYFRKPGFENAAIVSPDVGRAKFAGKYAENLGLPLVVMHKRREGFAHTEVTHVVGDIEDKIPIIIDDVIAGGSILHQIDALIKAGARPEIYLSITHGVLLPSALDSLEDPRIKKLVISDTICQPEAIRNHPKIEVLSIATLLAQAIWRIHLGQSISDLIEKT